MTVPGEKRICTRTQTLAGTDRGSCVPTSRSTLLHDSGIRFRLSGRAAVKPVRRFLTWKKAALPLPFAVFPLRPRKQNP